eukprot:10414349-Karenia_brevis.AAC.1
MSDGQSTRVSRSSSVAPSALVTHSSLSRSLETIQTNIMAQLVENNSKLIGTFNASSAQILKD